MKIWMVVAVVVAVVAGAAIGLMVPAIAEDPAITACEAGAKHDQPEGMVYRRLKATLTEAKVEIDYELKFKADRPEKASHTCKYRYIPAADEFVFHVELNKQCSELIARDKIESWERKLLDVCEKLIAAIDRLETAMEKAVRGLGIYPIRAKDTKLSKAPPA
jgi:hypothetical protein